MRQLQMLLVLATSSTSSQKATTKTERAKNEITW
jgi:hypothetical protein